MIVPPGFRGRKRSRERLTHGNGDFDSERCLCEDTRILESTIGSKSMSRRGRHCLAIVSLVS